MIIDRYDRMKEIKVKTFGALLVLAFLLMLPFVSLLGENDRAITVVQAYFDSIAAKKFDQGRKLCTDSYYKTFSGLGEDITQQFALETALLEHFKISPDTSYSVKAKRNRIWVPFMGNDTLELSLQIVARDKSESIVKNYLHFGKRKYLPRFITMVRDDGRWKIDDIHVEDSVIAVSFDKAKDLMAQTTFIEQQGGELKISSKTLVISRMDPIEKRIVSFQLNKFLSLMNRVAEKTE